MTRTKTAAAAWILLFSILLNPGCAFAQDNPPPGVPRDLTLTDVGQKNVRFEWTPPGDDDIVCYYIYKDGKYYGSTVIITTNHSAFGLDPGTTYTFKVSAWDGCSEGPFSNGITVTTEGADSEHGNATGGITCPEEGVRLNALDRITGTASDSDGTVIKAGLLIADSEGRFLKPDMSCFEPPKDAQDYHIPVRNTGTNYSSWELDIGDFSVFADGEYLVKLCPSDGDYGTADEVRFTVDNTPPGPPESFSAQDITERSVKLVWESPSDIDTIGYYVYKNGGYLTSTASTSLNVNSLTPGTNYSFCVAAHDGLNTGTPCDALNIATLPEPVDPPKDPPLPSKERRSSKTGSRQKTPGYELSEYTDPVTGRTVTEATIIIGEGRGFINHLHDGNILADTTNYFPGKQISRETFILEEPLLSMAVREGCDFFIRGGLAGLYLATSQFTGENGGGPFEVSVQREVSQRMLSDFLATRPAFEPVSEAFLYQRGNNAPSIPLFACVPLPEGLKGVTPEGCAGFDAQGLPVGCRVGYITCGEEGRIFCRYDGVGFTDAYIMFPVCRSGIHRPVLYENPYTGYKGHWAEGALDRVLAEGIFAPVAAAVDPDAPVTGALFASMLAAVTGEDGAGESAVREGNDGQAITRYTLARTAARVLDRTADFDTAVRMGLLIGFGDGSLKPYRPATLAETAAVLCRLSEYMVVYSNEFDVNHNLPKQPPQLLLWRIKDFLDKI